MSKAKAMLEKIYKETSQKLGELNYAKTQLEKDIAECHDSIAQLNKILPHAVELDKELFAQEVKNEPTPQA